MKLAFCYWRVAQRALRFVYKNHIASIYDVLMKSNIEFDIYMHSYNMKVFHNPWGKENKIRVNPEDWRLIDPDFFETTNQDDFDATIDIKDYIQPGDNWYKLHKKTNIGLNHVRELNSLNIVTNMWMPKRDNYDFICYLRPDLEFMNKFSVSYLDTIMENEIGVPSWGACGGVNDRFSIGKPEHMDIYGKRVINAKVGGQFLFKESKHRFLRKRNDKGLMAESFLLKELAENDVGVIDAPFWFKRVRCDGGRGHAFKDNFLDEVIEKVVKNNIFKYSESGKMRECEVEIHENAETVKSFYSRK